MIRSWKLALVVLALVACRTQDTRNPGGLPAGWVVVAPPVTDSTAARCADVALDAWSVALDANGSLVIVPARSNRSADTVRINGEMLIGDDFGEFGGAIWHQAVSGKRDTLHPTGRSPRDFNPDNLHAFVQRGERVFALVGLAHLFFNDGELLYLSRTSGGTWAAQSILKLRGEPRATTKVTDDTILVVAGDSIIAVTLDPVSPSRRALHGSSIWPLATSIVRDPLGTIYLGMRSGVARLTPDSRGFREDWLVQAECRTRVPDSSNSCRCEPGK